MSSVETIVDCEVDCDDAMFVSAHAIMMEVVKSIISIIGFIFFDRCIVFSPFDLEHVGFAVHHF